MVNLLHENFKIKCSVSQLQSFPIKRSGEKSDSTALVLCDIMGLGEGDSTGLSLYDALCVVKGHVMEGHTVLFKPK